MNPLTFILQSISGTTFFVSRPFLTTFGIALLGRWAAMNAATPVNVQMNVAGLDALVGGGADGLPWLLGNTALMIFGLLAALEIAANANIDARWYYDQALGVLQPGNAFAVTFSLGDWQYAAWVEMAERVLPPALAHAACASAGGSSHVLGAAASDTMLSVALLPSLGSVFVFGWALLVAVGTWLFGRLRARVMGALYALDEDNSLGIQTLLRWAETAWSAIGVYLLVIFPIVALLLFVLTLVGLFAVRKYFERLEQRTLVPCPNCATLITPVAPHCFHCRAPQPQPHKVGIFAQPTKQLAPEPSAHRFQLIGRKRCPFCAARLSERSVQQTCASCGTVTFEDVSAVNAYVRALDKKLPLTAAICFGLGAIPLIGLVPGIVYYRLSLIASLNGYIPRGVGCLTRWGVRVINILLIAIQSIPILGAAALPLMCAINYGVYRKVVVRESQQKIARTFEQVALSPAAADAAGSVAHMPTFILPVVVAEPAQLGTCPACTTVNQGDPRFCMQCGTRLHDEHA